MFCEILGVPELALLERVILYNETLLSATLGSLSSRIFR